MKEARTLCRVGASTLLHSQLGGGNFLLLLRICVRSFLLLLLLCSGQQSGNGQRHLVNSLPWTISSA